MKGIRATLGFMARSCAMFCTIVFAGVVLPSTLQAQCTPDAAPHVTSVDHQAGANNVTVRWSYNPSTFCVWPPDFYQVRWTQGEGPATQNQSPQVNIHTNTGSFVVGVNPSALYGFIVQACSNRTLAPANCTTWSPMGYYKPYGPGMCKQGFVWRNAFDGDKVCVTSQTRDEAAADNAAGPGRKQKNSDYCIQGFVWRGARPSDHVCVTPATRSEVAADNAQAGNRALPPP
jgi:hypothetical protein